MGGGAVCDGSQSEYVVSRRAGGGRGKYAILEYIRSRWEGGMCDESLSKYVVMDP